MNRVFLIDGHFTIGAFRPYRDIITDTAPRHGDSIIVAEGIDDPRIPYAFSDHGDAIIPVGDIPFIRKCLSLADSPADPNITPLEVPAVLRKFLPYSYDIKTSEELLLLPEDELSPRLYFMKDASELKHFNSALQVCNLSNFIEPDRRYVLAAKICFTSEYRIFVYEDEVLACQNYLGDPLVFPNADTIQEMIAEYSRVQHPRAYTLDIGVIANEDEWIESEAVVPSNIADIARVTVPIEVHPFAACGLYGFAGREIPDMLETSWHWYLSEATTR